MPRVTKLLRAALATIASAALIAASTAIPAQAAPSTLDTHTVLLDGGGKLLSWVPQQDKAYATVSKLSFDYLLGSTIPVVEGKPAFYSHSYLTPSDGQPAGWPHNPAGLYSTLIESANRYYQFTGDRRVITLATGVADHQLAYGMTEATDAWASVPYASGDSGSLTYAGASYGDVSGAGDGRGVIQPDKIGDFSSELVTLYEITGTTRYLTEAMHGADVLAATVRPGDATHSPWPFRVYGADGEPREEYGANLAGTFELFDALIRLKAGTDTQLTAWTRARTTAWNWMMAYPMKTNHWSQYFEDVDIQPTPSSNLNQLDAMMVARYLLENPQTDAAWETHVRGLIRWVEATFTDTGHDDNFGATTIREQQAFFYRMGSHTARYASVNALLAAKTGDAAAREKAYRSFNWATYMARSNGVVIDGPEVNNQWFTDGYGDYVRHFMVGMGAIPAFAPATETHLLGTSSTIRTVSYATAGVTYTTAGPGAETIKMPTAPTQVTVDGTKIAQGTAANTWSYETATKVLTVRRPTGTSVAVSQTSVPVTPRPRPIVSVTAPTRLASSPANTPVALAASVVNVKGATHTVRFYVDRRLVGSDATSPYAVSASLAAGKHDLIVTATADDGQRAQSAHVPFVVRAAAAGSPATPSPWTSTDVGAVGLAGSSSEANGVVTVRGSGVDVWDAADSFHFRQQRLGTRQSITARVATQQNTDPWALAGVMIRADLTAGSRHVLLAATPGHGVALDYRTTNGAATTYAEAQTTGAPVWLRLARSGTTVTASTSANGTTWRSVGVVTLDAGATPYVGLAVTAHDNTVLGTATFTDVTVR